MRTRLLSAALLTLGLLFTLTGGMAVAQQIEGPGGAGGSQYGGEDPDGGGEDPDGGGEDPDGGGVDSDGGGVDSDGGGGGDGDGFADGVGDGDGDGGGDGSGFSAEDQGDAGDGGVGLANTGFLAIPLLLLGVVMFGAGAFVSTSARKR